jgi:hypothetical protein
MFLHASLKVLPPQGNTKLLKLILRHSKILVNETTRHHEEFQNRGIADSPLGASATLQFLRRYCVHFYVGR